MKFKATQEWPIFSATLIINIYGRLKTTVFPAFYRWKGIFAKRLNNMETNPSSYLPWVIMLTWLALAERSWRHRTSLQSLVWFFSNVFVIVEESHHPNRGGVGRKISVRTEKSHGKGRRQMNKRKCRNEITDLTVAKYRYKQTNALQWRSYLFWF